jgi:hypothetical protein
LEGVFAIFDEDAKTSSFKKVPVEFAVSWNSIRIFTILTLTPRGGWTSAARPFRDAGGNEMKF